MFFLVGFLWGNNGVFPKYNLSASAAMGRVEKEKNPIVLMLAGVTLPIGNIKDKQCEESEEPIIKEVVKKAESQPLPQKESVGGIQICNETDYNLNKEELLLEPLVTYGGNGIEVLIIHTHTSEAFTPTKEHNYTETDSYRTTDETMNVVAVGEAMTEKLRNAGVKVLHDKTPHDSPEYSGCYRRALDTINKNIANNPSINIILDIHRDAISDGNGGFYKAVTNINGEDVAECMIVVGTNKSGLEHDNFKENVKYALRLQNIMNEKYPSLARPLNIRRERFNGHAREGAMIIEIGTNGNSLVEALKCGEYVGECVAELVNSY